MPRTPNLPEAELQGFLAAIAANPGEDTPRLAFSDWLQEHGDPRAAWVRDAALWKWMAPDAGDPVPRILAALAQPERLSRESALVELVDRIGPAAVPVVRAWVREAPDNRFPAIYDYLKQARPPKLRSVAALMQLIRTREWYDVWEAVVDLGFHGPKAAKAVDLLLHLPRYDKWDEFSEDYHGQENPIDATVARTLGAIGPAAKKAIPMLAGSGWYNRTAWDVLGKLKPDPIAVLEHLNTDDDWDTQNGVRVVAQLDPTKTIAALSHAVIHFTGRVRYGAANILTEMGAEAAGAVPALIEALLNLTQWDREYALTCLLGALRSVGDGARTAIPAIHTKLASGETSPQLRADLGVALAQLGEPVEGSAVLTAALEEMTPEERGQNSRSVTAVTALLRQVSLQ